MYNFIFGKDIDKPNLNRSWIFKEYGNKSEGVSENYLVEIDVEKVARVLGVKREEAEKITETVVYSIFRMKQWVGSGELETLLK